MASLSESKPSIGFYPNELSASIARWRPFNERFLGITPPTRCSFDKILFAIIMLLFILNVCVDFT
ncbi:hypothetical protein KVC65_06520 [Helicobacter pylori]|nr:hypothetical protein KVC65_06520 [Helicobacter pylori]